MADNFGKSDSLYECKWPWSWTYMVFVVVLVVISHRSNLSIYQSINLSTQCVDRSSQVICSGRLIWPAVCVVVAGRKRELIAVDIFLAQVQIVRWSGLQFLFRYVRSSGVAIVQLQLRLLFFSQICPWDVSTWPQDLQWQIEHITFAHLR